MTNNSSSTEEQQYKIKYSPSRISSFDGCKLKYKYGYIDKIHSDTEAIETFRGSTAHKALEDFYKLVKSGTTKPLEWVLGRYKEEWEKSYPENIKVVKKDVSIEDYFKKGQQALTDYYEKYKPFNQTKIVDTERLLKFSINRNDKEYSFHGKLDRLDWNDKDSIFEIHDYKVTNRLMTQEEADTDWQLGLYHIALKEKWPDIKKVKLVWHSLLFNKEIVSFRTEEQLKALEDNLVTKVEEIESCTEFPPDKSILCNWCDYQNICPLWKHPKQMEMLPVNEYKKDPGVKLVVEYAKLEIEKSELEEKIDAIEIVQAQIKEAAIEFAEKNKVKIIDGPSAQFKIDIKDELAAPTKAEDPRSWKELRDILIKEGKYNDVSTVHSKSISAVISRGEWPAEFVKKIMKFLQHKITKTVKLIKK